MDRLAVVVLVNALVVQMIGDLIYYIFLYNPDLGYVSHVFGFYTGLFFTFLLGGMLCSWECKNAIQLSLSVLGGVALTLELVLLIISVYESWPPTPYLSGVIRNNVNEGCCAHLWALVKSTNYSFEYIQKHAYCDNDYLNFSPK